MLLDNLPDPDLVVFTPPSIRLEPAPAHIRAEAALPTPPIATFDSMAPAHIEAGATPAAPSSIVPMESAGPPALATVPGLPANVRIDGDVNGNRVVIEPSDRHVRLIITLRGKGNTVVVKRDCALNAVLSVADGAHIEIGEQTEMQGAHIVAQEGARCTIGARCRFSTNTRLQSSDPYAVFDAETQERINPPRPIVIEDGVWVSDHVQIARGTKIGTGSVIGAASVLSGDYPARSLIAGRPGRVVRTGIRWQL